MHTETQVYGAVATTSFYTMNQAKPSPKTPPSPISCASSLPTSTPISNKVSSSHIYASQVLDRTKMNVALMKEMEGHFLGGCPPTHYPHLLVFGLSAQNRQLLKTEARSVHTWLCFLVLSFVSTYCRYPYADRLPISFAGIVLVPSSPRVSTTSNNHIFLLTSFGGIHILIVINKDMTLLSLFHPMRRSSRQCYMNVTYKTPTQLTASSAS